ncbi:MAG: response regulator [Acidobacteriota bacterium]
MRRKILFVEDGEDAVLLVTTLLDSSLYEIVSARSYAEGLEAVRGGNFDLFLLDIGLPDGDGLQLCRDIRKFDGKTPVIFLTGKLDFDRELAIEAGAQALLLKPYNLDELRFTLKRLLFPSSEQ